MFSLVRNWSKAERVDASREDEEPDRKMSSTKKQIFIYINILQFREQQRRLSPGGRNILGAEQNSINKL